MQHLVEKQGKFRYYTWEDRKLVTHDRDNCAFLQRKTHPGSKKMAVEQVVLWPHFDRHTIMESMSSTAAARTVILRGRLHPVSFQDLDFLQSVRKKSLARGTTITVAAAAAGHSSDSSITTGPEGGKAAAGPGASLASLRDRPTPGPLGGNFITSDEDDEEKADGKQNGSTSSLTLVEPIPAGLNYRNPLVGAPGRVRRGTGSAGYANRTNHDSDSDEDDDDEEEDDAPCDASGIPLDAFGTVGTGKSTKKSRSWVLRLKTLDSVRSFIRGLQGIDEYQAATGGERVPFPASAFVGSFEEIEEEIRRIKTT